MSRRFLAGLVVTLTATVPLVAQDSDAVSMETIERWRAELSNAGRWGGDDELGALNLITPEKRRAAAALVRDGVSVSMAHEMLVDVAPDNPSPLEHEMLATGSNDNPSSYAMDSLAVAYHGFAQTHLDALCHVWHGDAMYNGHGRAQVTDDGCGALDIDAIRNGVFTRGVLVDIPWVRGVPYLEPGTAITVDDLEAFEKKSGIEIGAGDALMLRTGRWARRAEKGPTNLMAGIAGLHASTAPWLKARDIALLGSDAGSDVVPSGVEGASGMFLPIHELAIVTMGVAIIDNADLEGVSEEAQKRGRFEFLLTLAPLRVSGGTGSPINPIATF